MANPVQQVGQAAGATGGGAPAPAQRQTPQQAQTPAATGGAPAPVTQPEISALTAAGATVTGDSVTLDGQTMPTSQAVLALRQSDGTQESVQSNF